MTTHALWQALALMAVIEGVMYAVFPDGMKRLIAQVQEQPSDALRMVGLGVAFLGVACLWWLRG